VTSDPFAMFDGAYVLGALSDDDRDAFEAHLAECDACSASVRQLSDLPAMLATVPESALVDEAPPLSLLPALQRRARGAVRRRRWIVSGVAAAAACVLALAVVVSWPTSKPASHPVAMAAVANAPITATADVRDVGWGTKIKLVCRYHETSQPERPYALVVVDRSGKHHDLGSWNLVPGKATTYESGIALPRSQVKEVDITTVSGKPLLALSL
jgi:anti-sigma-K factor RskA